MPYFIVKPTRREREEKLREQTPRHLNGQVRGAARTLEEAQEIQRQHAKEGEEFNKLYAALDGPEVKRAHEDEMLRQGINPETNEHIPPKSYKTPWEWQKPVQ